MQQPHITYIVQHNNYTALTQTMKIGYKLLNIIYTEVDIKNFIKDVMENYDISYENYEKWYSLDRRDIEQILFWLNEADIKNVII